MVQRLGPSRITGTNHSCRVVQITTVGCSMPVPARPRGRRGAGRDCGAGRRLLGAPAAAPRTRSVTLSPSLSRALSLFVCVWAEGRWGAGGSRRCFPHMLRHSLSLCVCVCVGRWGLPPCASQQKKFQKEKEKRKKRLSRTSPLASVRSSGTESTFSNHPSRRFSRRLSVFPPVHRPSQKSEFFSSFFFLKPLHQVLGPGLRATV